MEKLIHSLIEYVRTMSPFYKQLYSHVPDQFSSIEELPLVDKEAFWQANTFEMNRVLTGPIDNGIVFKSGGTTSEPKFSVYSNADWKAFTRAFGWGMLAGGIETGEKIANIFYGGELYASFLFITRSVEEAGAGIVFPVAGSAPLEVMIKIIDGYQINTIAGLPGTCMKLAEKVQAAGTRLAVQKILYGGEPVFADQIRIFGEVFPGVRIQSIGIASVDGGELGFADSSCDVGEHRCFNSTLVELIDDDGKPITDTGVPGEMHVTNLQRRLMPIIRYPSGDRAVWMESEGTANRKYKLLGRSGYAARIGPVELTSAPVEKALHREYGNKAVAGWQIIVRHENMLDWATIRIALENPGREEDACTEKIIEAVYRERPMYLEEVEAGHIGALKVEWVHADGLACNTRTGKIPKIVDLRD